MDGSHVTALQTVTDWLKNNSASVVDKDSVNLITRCSICMRGSPLSTISAHCARDCGLLKTFNKLRAAVNLPAIQLTTGVLSASDKTVPITLERFSAKMEKELKELKGKIEKVEKGLIALENAKKRKQSMPSEPSSSAAPAAKKAKKDAAATKGTSETSGSKKSEKKASDTDKGKGKKAGGKKAAKE